MMPDPETKQDDGWSWLLPFVPKIERCDSPSSWSNCATSAFHEKKNLEWFPERGLKSDFDAGFMIPSEVETLSTHRRTQSSIHATFENTFDNYPSYFDSLSQHDATKVEEDDMRQLGMEGHGEEKNEEERRPQLEEEVTLLDAKHEPVLLDTSENLFGRFSNNEDSRGALHIDQLGNEEALHHLPPESKSGAPRTDSGYASRFDQGLDRLANLQPDQVAANCHEPFCVSINNHTRTVYSAESTIPDTHTQQYILRLCDSVQGQLGQRIDREAWSSLSQALPELLKAFAIRLGLESPSQKTEELCNSCIDAFSEFFQ